MSKKLITAIAAATLGASALSAPAFAEVTATAGFVSDYYYRGRNLGDGGANGSIDFANDSGVYGGIWAIDDGSGANDGLEYDIYFGYGAEVADGLGLSIGYTRYEYTYSGDFEQEVNLGASFGNFGLAIDIGEDDDEGDDEATDYVHIAASVAINDIYSVTLGNYTPDTQDDDTGADTDEGHTYIEVSAGGEVAGLDASMTIGTISEEDDVKETDTSGYLVLSVSKTFDGLGF